MMVIRSIDAPDTRAADTLASDTLARELAAIGRAARAAAAELALAPASAKRAALLAGAAEIRATAPEILDANLRDRHESGAGLSPALLDRLTPTPERVEAMAAALEEVAALPDPIGTSLAR